MIRGTIENIDELIALKLKAIELLRELRRNLDLAARAGVDPNLIARAGYDPTKDMRLHKWPARWLEGIDRPHNYVILKDGTRIEVPIDWETRKQEEREKMRAHRKTWGL